MNDIIDYLISTFVSKSVIVWDLNTYDKYLTINTYHYGLYTYSALLLFDDLNNSNYVVTCSTHDYIKLWSFDKSTFIRNIGSKNDYTYFINSFKHNSKYYIINANDDCVKIYGLEKENDLFGEYSGNERTWHISAFVERINDIDILFESYGLGYVGLWNLKNNKLIKSIHSPSCSLRGICLWNYQFVITAWNDKSFKVIDFVNEKCVNSIAGQHFNVLYTIKKIRHPKYGESLLSEASDGKIILWINKK